MALSIRNEELAKKFAAAIKIWADSGDIAEVSALYDIYQPAKEFLNARHKSEWRESLLPIAWTFFNEDTLEFTRLLCKELIKKHGGFNFFNDKPTPLLAKLKQLVSEEKPTFFSAPNVHAGIQHLIATSPLSKGESVPDILREYEKIYKYTYSTPLVVTPEQRAAVAGMAPPPRIHELEKKPDVAVVSTTPPPASSTLLTHRELQQLKEVGDREKLVSALSAALGATDEEKREAPAKKLAPPPAASAAATSRAPAAIGRTPAP